MNFLMQIFNVLKKYITDKDFNSLNNKLKQMEKLRWNMCCSTFLI
jgi:hypothetical protein